MHYDFDEIIDRRGTRALNTDGFRSYIFKDVEGKKKFGSLSNVGVPTKSSTANGRE